MEYMSMHPAKKRVVPVPPKTSWKRSSRSPFWIGLLAVGTLFGCLLGLNVVLVRSGSPWRARSASRRTARASELDVPLRCHSEMAPAPELVPRSSVLVERREAPRAP